MPRSERDNAPASASASLRVNDAILDGEIICADETGRPIFIEMLGGRHPVCFVAFDLLWLNGEELRRLPLIERKARLRRLLRRRANHTITEALAIEGAARRSWLPSRRTILRALSRRGRVMPIAAT
jgi:bifunctional non-homologous end joining protein LigD